MTGIATSACYCLCDHHTPYKGRIRSAIKKKRGSTAMPVAVRSLVTEDKHKRQGH